MNTAESPVFVMPTTRTYFPALTGLRAVAAYLIFIHHYLANHPDLPRHLNYFVTKFPAGLLLFFVLTGFLISFRYLSDPDLTRHELKRYFLNRVVRIFPIYLLLTCLTLWLAGERDTWVWLTNITLTKAFFNEYKLTGIAQAWSLTVDETFYLLAPVFYLLYRKGLHFFWLLLLAFGTGFLLIELSNFFGWGSFFAHTKFMLRYTFFGLAFAFVLGMWLSNKFRKRPTGKPQKNWRTYAGFAGFFGTLYLWSFLAAEILPQLKANELGGILFYNFAMAAWCGLCIYGLVTEKTFISQVLGSRIFQVLGFSSYAFYLLHLGFFATFIQQKISGNPAIIFVLVSVAAYLLHKFVEQPLVDRYGGSRLIRPQTQKPGS